MRLRLFLIPMPTTRPWTPTQRCRGWVRTRSGKLLLRRPSQSGMAIPAPPPRSGARDHPRLLPPKRPPAADLHFEPGAHDSAVRGVGRRGEGPPFQGSASVSGQDRRVDPVSLLTARRRCRPYIGGRTDRSRKIRVAGVDGVAVSPLSEGPDLRL